RRREHRAGGGDDRLDVLRLVVRREYQPRRAGHFGRRTLIELRIGSLAAMSPRELSNAAIADALEELGDLYELDGAIVHRVLAYRGAAKSVREAPVSVAELAREGRAAELPGIGATLQEKIRALVEDGSIPAAEKLRAKFP